MYDWHSFAYAGDEWLVGYACLPAVTPFVAIFTVGHALELYLKAAHTKLFGDVEKVIKKGHNIKSLWDECKKRDGAFLPNHEIRGSILKVDFLDQHVFKTLTKDDQEHYIRYQNLYLIAKHLSDIKYFSLPWNSRKKGGEKAVCWTSHDSYWITLFKDIRVYLGYPPKGKADFVEQQLRTGMLPSYAVHYLRGLYV